MNTNKGDMYDFLTHTANPVRGECSHDCKYCYMKPINKRFRKEGTTTLRLDEKELNSNWGKGRYIMLGSSTDIFAENVPTKWLLKIYDKCYKHNKNRYLLQSKNPSRFLEPALINHPLMAKKGKKICFATTLESNRDYPEISQAPPISERVDAMEELRKNGQEHLMVTIEPIMQFDLDEFVRLIQRIRPQQVNIGSNTNNTVSLPEPTKDEVTLLIVELQKITNVHLKSNIRRLFK